MMARAFGRTTPPPFPREALEYPRIRLGRGVAPKLYTYAAPLGSTHPGDVVAVPANWVSPEGTLGVVWEVAAEPPSLPEGVQLKAVWRVIPPDQLRLFGWEE